MCCCCHQHHHNPHHQAHHHSQTCGCGSHSKPCDESGHEKAPKLKQVLEHLQTKVQAVEERIAALEES